jgi:adenylate cyclase
VIRKLGAGVAIGAGAAAVVLVLAAGGFLEVAELKLYDWRVRHAADPTSVNRGIVLVTITDTTLRQLEPAFGRWPWPRVAFASALDFFRRAPARVVAVDLLFLEPDRVAEYDLNGNKYTGESSDAALAAAVKAAGNVILLADAVDEGVVGGTDDSGPRTWRDPGYRLGPTIENRPALTPPLSSIAADAAGLGHNFLVLDSDGPVRRMAPFVRKGDRYMPSLGIAAALAAAGVRAEEVTLDDDAIRVRDARIPLVSERVAYVYDRRKTFERASTLVNYRAPTVDVKGNPPYATYEMWKILASEMLLGDGEKPLVSPAEFKDKIVFIGLDPRAGLGDSFQTPFAGAGTMPGIQVHATLADNLLANRFIRPARPASRIAAVLIAAAGVGLLTAFLPFSAAAIATAAILGGWTWLTFGAFKSGLWLNLVQPLVAGAIALFAGTAYQYFVEGREKRVVKKLFGRYVSRDVYAQLLANPELAELGGRRREMSVLFSDIRGFTTVTESGDAEAIVAQLNEYFSTMVDVVFRHGGTVDKFVGDMVMALFGAPLEDPDHAEHAVAAAVEMVRALGDLNRRWVAERKPQLDIGVGVNSGEMIAGNIGSSSIMSYTVIGDNVNLGSRLESLNKGYATRIIISDATRLRLKGSYDVRPLGDVVVKGKTKAVTIHEVRVPAPLVTTEEETL